MNQHLARFLIHSWPFKFGYGTLMKKISTPPHPADFVTTKIRGFPVSLKYNPNSYIGEHIWYRGIFEENIVSAIAKSLRPGMTFLDIGANIGLHTIVAANMVGNTGLVIAFEPQLACRNLLNENVSLNRLSNVTILGCALGSEETEGKIFHINDDNDAEATLRVNNVAEASDYELIKIRRLSDVMCELNIDRVDVVKVDIEGAEVEMLNGGADFLEKAKPETVFMECVDKHLSRFGNSSSEILSRFQRMGYRAYFHVRGKWKLYDSVEERSGDIMFKLRNTAAANCTNHL